MPSPLAILEPRCQDHLHDVHHGPLGQFPELRRGKGDVRAHHGALLGWPFRQAAAIYGERGETVMDDLQVDL